MATQAQGKGKKKNKEVTKLSLDEFNQTDAGEGYSVINLGKTGIDWAEAMADYEKSSIVVPVVPRSQRGPDVDFDSLPDEPPFRASLYNLPMSVEEKDIRDRFFQGLDIPRIEITKTSTTVEFNTKQDLYDALCKNGALLRNRTIDVVPYGPRPDNNRSDRYGGGRGGSSSYGDRGGRSEGGGFNRMGDRGGFNDRGFNRGDRDRDQDRDSYGGFSRSGAADDWRARPATVIKPQPSQPIPQQQHYQSKSYYNQQPRYQNHPPQPPQSIFQNRPGPNINNRQMNSWGGGAGQSPLPQGSAPPSEAEERPKLVLHKRATPLNVDDVDNFKRNEAIFGQAKPSSKPYEKMKEVEEKLKN